MTTTKGRIRSDFTHIRFLMREWERVLRERPDDIDTLLDIANELQACATTPAVWLEEQGHTR